MRSYDIDGRRKLALMRTVVSRPSTTFHMGTAKPLSLSDACTILKVPQSSATSSTGIDNKDQFSRSPSWFDQEARLLYEYCTGQCGE